MQYTVLILNILKIKKIAESDLTLCTTTSNDEVLYVDPFTYRVFSTDRFETTSEKYSISFMKYSLPRNYITKDNLLEVINTKKWQYVLGITVVDESDNYLFILYCYGDKIHFAVYDKKAKKVQSFRITNSDLYPNKYDFSKIPVNSDGYSVQNLFLKDDAILFYLQSVKDAAILKVKIQDIMM